MARLVARALRLGRSAFIQTGLSTWSGYQRYRVSYLLPLLMGTNPAIIVAPLSLQTHLLKEELPRLAEWVNHPKEIRQGDVFPGEGFQGLLLTTPEKWLEDRLQNGNLFPSGITTIIDGIDALEDWVNQQLMISIQPHDWYELMTNYPEEIERIREVRIKLTHLLFQRPINPYQCYLLESPEREILEELYRTLGRPYPLPLNWRDFDQKWQNYRPLKWVDIDRNQGTFSLYCTPLNLPEILAPIWLKQPLVLIGNSLDLDPKASIYREKIGLPELTCLKFSPDRNSESIQVYFSARLPLPNTPEFQPALLQELRTLLCLSASHIGLTVILAEDRPLKKQIGSILAAEFGSRVQVEKKTLSPQGILVTGWEFWQNYQNLFPSPHLLIITTLPIPSLENPLVAARVADYKYHRKDWFRYYLLPTALNEIQRAISPVRDSQGVVALLDNRVLYRSYGQQVLNALSPYAKIDYLDTIWLTQS